MKRLHWWLFWRLPMRPGERRSITFNGRRYWRGRPKKFPSMQRVWFSQAEIKETWDTAD